MSSDKEEYSLFAANSLSSELGKISFPNRNKDPEEGLSMVPMMFKRLHVHLKTLSTLFCRFR